MRWGEPSLSELLLGAYLALLTLAWGGMVLGVRGWVRRNRPPATPEGGRLPRLTVCVPARNEVDQIARCVRAVLDSDHPDLELLVVDDASTDGTGPAATAAAAGDPRFRLVQATPPPQGWAGKCWACALGAGEATGRHLLFIDADVRLSPSAARLAADQLVARRLSLLSAFGSWKVESFWERVAIPAIGWFIRGATDIPAVNTPGRKEAFANGQFILVEREAYDAVGGHGAVRAEVLDDVRLARVFKQAGCRLGLHFWPELFEVRLYRSLGEIIRGYTKNLYEGMDRRPIAAFGALLFMGIGSALPWILLVVAVAAPALALTGFSYPGVWTAWIAVVCFLPLLLRFRLERLEGRSGALFWAQPLGNAVLAVVLLRAMFQVRTVWKGRAFVDGRAAP